MNEYTVMIDIDSGEHLGSIRCNTLVVIPSVDDIVAFNDTHYKVLQRVLARWTVRLYVRELINSRWP